MSVQIKRRGDTTFAHQSFIGAEREITIDTDKKTIVVHDGQTAGGFPLARENMSNVSADNLKSRGSVLALDLVGIVFSAPLETLDGFLFCDGSEISRETYSALFARIGITFGEGDGETTFNIPDYRGCFLRCLGGRSIHNFTDTQEDAIRNISGYIYQCGLVTQSGYARGEGAFSRSSCGNQNGNGAEDGAFWTGGFGTNTYTFEASRVVPTALENRPINKAINFFIKY